MFVCHEIGHAKRKAGNERSFYTVETNFFPGRKFASLEDMNRQALEWSTVRMANRPKGKTRLIPAQAFEYEKPYFKKMSGYVPAPYLVHKRGTDQYGYASFDGNFYWIPGTAPRCKSAAICRAFDDLSESQASGSLPIAPRWR
jgi:hypothetical protein